MGVKLNTPRNLVNREATPKPVAEKAALPKKNFSSVRLNKPEPEEPEDDPNAEPDDNDEDDRAKPTLKLS